jgi:hypothetical protein
MQTAGKKRLLTARVQAAKKKKITFLLPSMIAHTREPISLLMS